MVVRMNHRFLIYSLSRLYLLFVLSGVPLCGFSTNVRKWCDENRQRDKNPQDSKQQAASTETTPSLHAQKKNWRERER